MVNSQIFGGDFGTGNESNFESGNVGGLNVGWTMPIFKINVSWKQ